ncbi:hypothetical protein [Catenibacterium mitsuokai]|uniref:hypothetical protein n=1 Tax=Catenibacterium mitsuokai TaxID=100886 RepID=UPI002418569C|nr:hypothetical protein [Catenibacterium tridentinum]
MIRNKKIVIRKSLLIALFWAIFVYLFSGSPYTTINTDLSMLTVLIAFAILPIMLFFRREKNGKLLLALLLISIMILISMISHSEFYSRAYWRLLAVVIIVSYLIEKYGFRNIVKVYLDIMFFVSIISLIGYLLLNFTSLLNNLPSVTNINGVEYGVGIIFNYIKALPERNCGIFWEPGIFASYLALAIAFESIINSNSISWFRVLVFVVSIITTTSSAGYVLLIFSLGIVLLRGSKLSGYKKMLAIIVVIGIAIVAFNIDNIILNTSLAQNKYLIKLTSDRMNQSSRITSIYHNLSIFRKRVLFGAGINSVLNQMSSWADISTSTYMLSIFGVMGSLYTLFIIYGIFSQKNINIFVKLFFFFILISIVNKEPHINIMFTWIIILGMLSDKNAICIKKKDY